MVYRAFSPLPPDTLTLLEEIRKRHCARISLDLALWTHERENERTYAFDATEGTYSVEASEQSCTGVLPPSHFQAGVGAHVGEFSTSFSERHRNRSCRSVAGGLQGDQGSISPGPETCYRAISGHHHDLEY